MAVCHRGRPNGLLICPIIRKRGSVVGRAGSSIRSGSDHSACASTKSTCLALLAADFSGSNSKVTKVYELYHCYTAPTVLSAHRPARTGSMRRKSLYLSKGKGACRGLKVAPFPVESIRTLDAVHLATAEVLAEPPALLRSRRQHRHVEHLARVKRVALGRDCAALRLKNASREMRWTTRIFGWACWSVPELQTLSRARGSAAPLASGPTRAPAVKLAP